MQLFTRLRSSKLALTMTAIFAGLSLLISTPLKADDMPGAAGIAVMGMFAIFMFVVAAGVYVYIALAFQTIAKKTNTPDDWWAWVPVMNLLLLAKIAKKEVWWGLLCLIPVVGIVFMIIMMMAVAEARNKPSWWGILLIIPVVGLVVPGYLAWVD